MRHRMHQVKQLLIEFSLFAVSLLVAVSYFDDGMLCQPSQIYWLFGSAVFYFFTTGMQMALMIALCVSKDFLQFSRNIQIVFLTVLIPLNSLWLAYGVVTLIYGNDIVCVNEDANAALIYQTVKIVVYYGVIITLTLWLALLHMKVNPQYWHAESDGKSAEHIPYLYALHHLNITRYGSLQSKDQTSCPACQ